MSIGPNTHTVYVCIWALREPPKEATEAQARYVVTIADYEGMPGHRDSAQRRLDLTASPVADQLGNARPEL